MRIYDQKKTSTKMVQKSDFGGSWASFGKGLGRSGASWGHFWAHFDCLLDVPNHIFLKQWAKMSSKRLFGWLLDRFWERLGRIWMRLGRIWAFKIKAFASHGHFLNTLGVPCCFTLRYKNPRAASLRLAERHNWKSSQTSFRKKQEVLWAGSIPKTGYVASLAFKFVSVAQGWHSVPILLQVVSPQAVDF